MSADDKPRRRKLSEDERALWREVRRSIKPLRKKPADGRDAAGCRLASAAAQAAGTHAGIAERPAPVRTAEPPLAALDRRDRDSGWRAAPLAIDDRLDLHGRTQSEAHGRLLRFLRSAQSEGARFVLVITGKGERAAAIGANAACSGARCRSGCALPEFRAYVVGFEDAHVAHGGQGALYVRLRRKPVLGTVRTKPNRRSTGGLSNGLLNLFVRQRHVLFRVRRHGVE